MGSIVSTAANGIGAVLGSAFASPFKAIFARSCEGVCSGTWDIICFVEHLCISRVLKLLMVSVLTYITLLFFYLLFKVGIIQCIGRSLCKMAWAGCETYWTALEEITCFLWNKLRNTKRVYRHRFEEIEEGFNSISEDYSLEDYSSRRVTRRRKSEKDRRKDHIRRSLYPTSHSLKERSRNGSHHHHHHVRLKTREVSVHVKGSERVRTSKQLQLRKSTHHRRHKI